MNRKQHLCGLGLLVLLSTLIAGPGLADDPTPLAAPLGTAFTYQGRLEQDGAPVNGSCDLVFKLWDALDDGAQIGGALTRTNVALAQGVFTVQLDFGAGAFTGSARWLAIEVRCPAGAGAYTPLTPRQALTAAPYALYARTAPWSGITGMPAAFADGVDNNTTYTAGSGLTLSGTEFSANLAGSGVAATVARSDHHHLSQTWIGTNNPLVISGTFGAPTYASLILGNTNPSGDGLRIQSAQADGIHVAWAGSRGVTVWQSENNGIAVRFAGHPAWGFSPGTADGLEIMGAEGYGVVVGIAGLDGVYARSMGASNYGGRFANTATGGVGLYACGGSNTAPDLVLGGDGDSTDDGRIKSDPEYVSSDLFWLSNDAVQVELDNDNDENGNFYILNGANATVFNVNESGDMTAIGTKAATVGTHDYGYRQLYAVESPAVWFEDFGAAELVGGRATVTIEAIFAQTVNLSATYHVFLTPLGDCPLYVAEKTAASFTVQAMSGRECSIAFDYRIIAPRLGYEELRLGPAVDPALMAEPETQELER